MMTAIATIAGLIPVMHGTGVGSEVMSRIATPMLGGMVSVVILTLLVLPVACYQVTLLSDSIRLKNAQCSNSQI
jgi:Cu(I)/Ag(I) efflux system membrane protein CusA/SilA